MNTKQDQPLVSAVIPTRNRPDLVCEAVRSALRQTYKNLEVVVVIDGPDRSTVTALEALHEPRLRIVALAENVGGSEARNIGVRQANGKYVALLDDDDEWLPTKIEKQVSLAERHRPAEALVVCKITLRNAAGDSTIPYRAPHATEPMSEYLMSSSRNGFQTSSYFCSRELLLTVPWTKGLKGLQDFDWFLRVTAIPNVQLLVVEEPLSIYRMDRPGTITSKLGWNVCYEWGTRNRELMTRKAYSYFLSRVCANRAAQQRAGLAALLMLFRGSLSDGRPSTRSVLLFLGYVLFPYRLRCFIGNVLGSIIAKRPVRLAH